MRSVVCTLPVGTHCYGRGQTFLLRDWFSRPQLKEQVMPWPAWHGRGPVCLDRGGAHRVHGERTPPPPQGKCSPWQAFMVSCAHPYLPREKMWNAFYPYVPPFATHPLPLFNLVMSSRRVVTTSGSTIADVVSNILALGTRAT